MRRAWRNSAAAHAERVAARKAAGIANGRRLDRAMANRIRRALASGADTAALAEAYRVTRNTINSIGRGKTWGGPA